MLKRLSLLVLWACPWALLAQIGPEITSWIINTDGSTGYNGIPSNVQTVQYAANFVYVGVSGIPDYDIGPWQNNPNTPVETDFKFKITRNPQQNTGNPTPTPLGHIGIWTNGVSIFNADDGMSYQNQNVWNRNAAFWEGISFDDCLGHPAPGGEYHHHVNPKCLYDDSDNTVHAPIIGYAFDGFPIYGAYAWSGTNGTGYIKRMRSSYRTKNLSSRLNGPPVNNQYPLGCFLEDYEYVAGLGDLDAHNGRFCVTPEYPNGIYAYFVTIDTNTVPVYPYVLGPTYYGVVTPGNIGPNSGHVVVNEPVTSYTPSTSLEPEVYASSDLNVFPNPADAAFQLLLNTERSETYTLQIVDARGVTVHTETDLLPKQSYTLRADYLPDGVYYLRVQGAAGWSVRKLLIRR